DIRSTGAAVAETSFYPALSNLFNEIGKTLKPKVRCVMPIADRGAGLPDGGFFSADQFQKASDTKPKAGQFPARGVVEVKGPAQDVRTIARSKQVKRYGAEYGLVLVTNYRDFLLVGRDVQGKPLPMEGFALAENEAAFWSAAVHPQKTAEEHGERFCEYLKRVMLSSAPLSDPQDVAWFLASYARDAKVRVESHKDLSALAAVRQALEEALGMKFTGPEGEHFFRSTLVQTIFYGVFSAWVLWHRERPDRTDAFDWRVAEWFLRVPFIRTLYHQVASAERLGPLGLVESLDWTAAALNRVQRAMFFQKFQDEHAVQYFYEPFLEEFDPDLRKKLGVWFTPPEIVQYQVARVDTVLREELGLADGLADPNVIVLDPCCGTGAYLVEVLKRIAETLRKNGGDALIPSDLKKAAMTRVFGFEILPAPFVVSHLQLGLMLQRLGAPLSVRDNERVGVYLTNSLTGWEPPKGAKKQLMLPELAAEREAADRVKREAKVLVVLGNPPYNAFAGVSPDEEQGLVEPYKEGLNRPAAEGGWGIKKFNLDDLYVRFFRLAEHRIAEMTGRGVVSFISNFSYLGDPSFVVMRQRFLSEFDRLWFDCMNGDSRETGKLTPDGKPDPSVFSTEHNREGIRVGTAICVMVRKEKREKKPVVLFQHFWGATKRQDLLASLKTADTPDSLAEADPCKENRYSFRPENVSAEYNTWPRLPDLCEAPPSNGLMEKRGGALIDIDKDAVEARMRDYFNPDLSWDDYRARQTALTKPQGRFVPARARKKALAAEGFDPKRILRYAIRPFETRWCYYTGVRPVWNEPRPALWEQYWAGNSFLVTRSYSSKNPEGTPIFITPRLIDAQML
ncbi:MAG TPA: type ISP restriction/modification enzyme, partial [Phycisphaerae bacterium]|nr:type ISP restriction/modification enzyme [Phycisphaerae bacterium]